MEGETDSPKETGRPNVGCSPGMMENLETLSLLAEILNVEKMYRCQGVVRK